MEEQEMKKIADQRKKEKMEERLARYSNTGLPVDIAHK